MKNCFFVIMVLLSVSYGAINKYWHVASNGTGTAEEGVSWATAIDLDTLEKVLENTVIAGDVFFIKNGTYTAKGSIDFNTRDGSATSPIALIGVKAATTNEGAAVVYSDWAIDSADRPLLNFGSTYTFQGSDYCIYKNLMVVGAPFTLFTSGLESFYYNCKFHNSATSTNRLALIAGNYSHLCEVEAISDSGNAITGSYLRLKACYVHDTKHPSYGNACLVVGGYWVIDGCRFSNCTNAINTTADHYGYVSKCSAYACGNFISATTDHGWAVYDCIVDGNTVNGFLWTTQTDGNFFWNNHGNDTRNTDMWDGVDETTCFQDYRVTTGDPLFINPAVDSLQLEATSPCSLAIEPQRKL